MLNKYFLSLFFCCIFLPGFSQELSAPLRFEQLSEIDFGLNDADLLIQANYQHIYGLDNENHFRVGYGLAFVRYRSFENVNYTTKNAEQNINQGLDSLQVKNPAISSLNLFLLLNYAPNNRIDFSLSLDVLGIGWGSTQDAVLASGADDPSPQGALAEPVFFNSPVFASGSWRSQFHLRYWLYPRWALQAGITSWVSAYQVNENLGLEEEVFNQSMFFWKLGISFRWGEQVY